MSERTRLPPQLALNRFLDAVRDEAATNPGFRGRLLEALAIEIYIEGEEEISAVDPIGLARSKSEATFRRVYSQLNATALRAVLRDADLATATDLKGQTKASLIDMLWSRSRSRAAERGLE